jgi:nicotinic acid phosphoribosyltransferase
VYRIRAHTAAGHAWICTLGSSFDSALDAVEIIVDALPPVPPLLKPWYVVQHTKH